MLVRIYVAIVAALIALSAISHAEEPSAPASAACGRAAEAGPPIVCSPCDAADARRRAASDDARVFTRPDGDGRSLYGCLLDQGKPRRLGKPGAYSDRWGDHQDTWRLVRTRGTYAAFERGYFGCPSRHCRKSELNVYDLRTGERTLRWTSEPGEPYYVGSSDLALAEDGSLAWISHRQGRVWLARAESPRKAKWLGHLADPKSLQLHGNTLSWTRKGERHEFDLSAAS